MAKKWSPFCLSYGWKRISHVSCPMAEKVKHLSAVLCLKKKGSFRLPYGWKRESHFSCLLAEKVKLILYVLWLKKRGLFCLAFWWKFDLLYGRKSEAYFVYPMAEKVKLLSSALPLRKLCLMIFTSHLHSSLVHLVIEICISKRLIVWFKIKKKQDLKLIFMVISPP